MTRRENREMAMKALFQEAFHDDNANIPYDVMEDDSVVSESTKAFVDKRIQAFRENKETVDGYIKKYSKGWDFDRIGKVELAVFRLALTEMFYISKVPPNVAISEAIDISKKYTEEKSYKFINGILGNIYRNEINEQGKK